MTQNHWRHDTQHNDIQHNDIQHNDNQHKGAVCDTLHKGQSALTVLSKKTLLLC
jgi:hypothetical protein